MKTPLRASPKFFKTSDALRAWFLKNHTKKTELWIGFYKKSSAKKATTYSEALDQALCFGWIDGIKKSVDLDSFTNRFTPRTATSKWSKINTVHVTRLIKAGLMTPSGMNEVEKAKKDGRWLRAYEPPSTAQVPEDFMKALAKHKKAKAFFETISKSNRFAITYRLQHSKKPETRQKWITHIIDMLRKGETFHL